MSNCMRNGCNGFATAHDTNMDPNLLAKVVFVSQLISFGSSQTYFQLLLS